MSGIRLPLKASEAVAVCDAYGGTRLDFERVMAIEAIVYPILQEQDKAARE